MSKLSQLKKDAYQAGKKRNWEEAVVLYERILELDKNNPTIINELGDLCLKAAKTPQAVRHFLNAAAKYRHTGLLNNAVAIYKKILRYDAENLNAHWYLAETRSAQGLVVEGESHGIHFLDSSSEVHGDIKEIFLKRCVKLFELYPGSEPISERLVAIFRSWDMNLEAARACCLQAACRWDDGRQDEAREVVADMETRCPEVLNYPEWNAWLRRAHPERAKATGPGYGDVPLDDEAPPAEPPTVESGAGESDDEPVAAGPAAPATPAAVPDVDQVPAAPADEDGIIAIDADDTGDMQALLAAATDEVAGAGGDAPEPASTEDVAAEDGGGVDLLAEILADDANVLSGAESSQLDSITRDIGAQMGGEADQDPASLYETGTVYLEMGLYDQACASFEQIVASGDAKYELRALEMWGVTLQRSGNWDEAVAVLRRGLERARPDSAEHLGLLYNIGKCCEEAGNMDQAISAYEEIGVRNPAYLDVRSRLERLSTV